MKQLRHTAILLLFTGAILLLTARLYPFRTPPDKRPSPPALTSAIAGTAGSWFVIEDGVLYAWGEDFQNPDYSRTTYEERVPLFEGAVSVWGSRFITLVLDREGNLWTSGASGREEPERKGNWELVLTDVVTASQALWNGGAVRSDGSLWIWGRNDRGQLYNGEKDPTGKFYPPHRVMENVRLIRRGQFVITENGDLYGLDLWENQTEPAFLTSRVWDVSIKEVLMEDGSLHRMSWPTRENPEWTLTSLETYDVDAVFPEAYRTKAGNFFFLDYQSDLPLAQTNHVFVDGDVTFCDINLDGALLYTADNHLHLADITKSKLTMEQLK